MAIAQKLFTALAFAAIARAAPADCDDGNSAACAAKPRRGSAMLQADTAARQLASASEAEGHEAAALLETHKQESKSSLANDLKAQPLTGKVNTIVSEVGKLQENVGKLEKAVGVGPGTGATGGVATAGSVTAAPIAPASTPEVEEQTAEQAVEPELFEEEEQPAAGTAALEQIKSKIHKRAGHSAAGEQAKTRRVQLEKGRIVSRQKVHGSGSQLRESDVNDDGIDQGRGEIEFLQKASAENWHLGSTGTTHGHKGYQAPEGSLKAKVSSSEAAIADLKSRISALENEVMGRSLPSVALNQVNAITKTKGAGAVAQDPSGALKSRISKMEDEVDDLRTRTNTLVHDVMG